MTPPKPYIGTLIIVSAAVCFGLVPLFARLLLDAGLSPAAIALYRFGLALPLALVFLPYRRGAARSTIVLIVAGLASGLGWLAFGERIGLLEATGALMVIAAIAVMPSVAPARAVLPRLLAGAREPT